ncbi:tetratricopeptide repeat protein [Maribacter sp. 2308TA10-17]|uniref:tetratricopeptide repeat protein n=1 Tax=Maribacter sp. 2308TA10-17 TaxID=3386276 RepID=UPI0039BC6DAE
MSDKTWYQDLWDRKVPQYLGTYFAIGFGLFQFLELISKRYDLSSNLVDKYLLVWFALIPAVITIAYFSDQLNPKTKSGVVKWPKFLILGNIVVAFVLGGLLFNDNRSNSEIVSIVDKEGKEVKVAVPDLKKVKTVASFRFENLTDDIDLDWWGSAFSELLAHSLEQRPEFYVYSQFGLHRNYDELGLTAFSLPNVAIQRKIAQKTRNDFFTRLSYSIVDDQYSFKGNLYSSKNGKSIISLEAKDKNPYTAIDAIQKQIFEQIPDPYTTDDSQINLPSSSLISGNVKALEYYTKSRITFGKNPSELEEVVQLAKKAVENDNTCALCHFYVADPLYGQGKREEAIASAKKAIQYGASLPNRMQFGMKGMLYGISDEMESYIKLLEMRRKMFPYDFSPYQQLLVLYKTNYGIDSAKVLIREAIDNGNIEKGLLELYDLQVENEEYLEAEKTLDRYSQEFPDREQDRLKYADIYEKQGKINKAKEILLEEETIDPLNTTVQSRLAYLDFKNQNIIGANDRLRKAMAQSSSLTDSLNYLWIKGYFLRMQGQITKSIEVLEDYEKYGVKIMPLNRVLGVTVMIKSDLYNSVGKVAEVDKLLEKMNEYSPGSALAYGCNVQASAIFREYPLEIPDDEFLPCGDLYKSYGGGFEEYYNLVNSYRVGKYEECLSILENDSTGRIKKLLETAGYFLADIYYKNGDVQSAKDILEKAIEQKTDEPFYYYKMAIILEKENKQKAREYLDIVMKYWSDADADFVLLKKATELSERLLDYDAIQS